MEEIYLIGPPQFRLSTASNGQRRKMMYYPTNLGWKTTNDLSDLLGISKQRLGQRVAARGWDYPGLLNTKHLKKSKGHTHKKHELIADLDEREFATKEWAALGSRPRDANWLKIRRLGSWERGQINESRTSF